MAALLLLLRPPFAAIVALRLLARLFAPGRLVLLGAMVALRSACALIRLRRCDAHRMLRHWNLLPDGALDIAQQRSLFVVAERYRFTGSAGARGAADAVDIGIGHERQ